MSFVVSAVAFISLVLGVGGSPNPPVGKQLFYYMNQPESVRRPGVVGIANAPSDTRVRVFFHFINKTRRTQRFVLSSSQVVDEVRSGFAIDPSPGMAGTKSISAFLDTKASPHQKVFMDATVRPMDTISGLVDATTNRATQFQCRLGSGVAVVPHSATVITAVLDLVKPMVVRDSPVTIHLGDKLKWHIDGDYGVTDHIKIVNASHIDREIQLSMTPRAGPLAMAYILNGKKTVTKWVRPYQSIRLGSVLIPAGASAEMITINPGGWNYPVWIIAEPVNWSHLPPSSLALSKSAPGVYPAIRE